MKITIITVCYNSVSHIEDAINSVANQDYKEIEHIVIDGNSYDGTQEVLQKYSGKIAHWISEPDKGIYDAMNKGIKIASGEVIGSLNSDDFYFDNQVISKVVEAFADQKTDAVFGDLIFVDPDNLSRTLRTYSSNSWHPEKFAKGYMPAHPTFFVKRKYYEKYGLFETDYKIAADYEMLIRLLYVYKLNYTYLPLKMVKMRKGGVSSNGIKSNITLNNDDIRACRKHGIKTNALKIYLKYFKKVFELFNHS
ncbi:MAG: glycosyltransferase [Cyclobacteriaceae bacterium]|nr:glycosyltransferase [Cyclobacteriaceae bacterium]